MSNEYKNPFTTNSGLINTSQNWWGTNTNDVFGRPQVNGLYYLGKKISLDGYTFIGCRFDKCNLEVSSTNFDLINCVIDPSTTISYAPSVLKIIKLFNSRFPWASEHFPGFVPTSNSDGTITISDR